MEVGRRCRTGRRCRGDEGTALVELALMIAPLCLLLFGIIVYGYMMSFRQNMTQAAAEGARAGAVAPIGSAESVAESAAENAVSSFGQHCGQSGMSCEADVISCATTNNPNAQCVRVTITFDEHNHPILPEIPLVTSALPNTFTSVSTVQINT